VVVTASVFVCERALQEKDDVISAIRIVDIFQLPPMVPQSANLPPYAIPLVGVAFFRTAQPDSAVHAFQFQLVRPSGAAALVQQPFLTPLALRAGGAPAGANLVVPINVLVKEFGVHELFALCDGVAIASASFTLAPMNP
jgi:hypothetical protein